jgi:hypothetical protein
VHRWSSEEHGVWSAAILFLDIGFDSNGMGQSLLPLYSLRKNQSTPVDLALFFNDRSLRCY